MYIYILYIHIYVHTHIYKYIYTRILYIYIYIQYIYIYTHANLHICWRSHCILPYLLCESISRSGGSIIFRWETINQQRGIKRLPPSRMLQNTVKYSRLDTISQRTEFWAHSQSCKFSRGYHTLSRAALWKSHSCNEMSFSCIHLWGFHFFLP